MVSYKKRKIVLFITVCFFTCHQYVRYSISKDSIISPKTIGVNFQLIRFQIDPILDSKYKICYYKIILIPQIKAEILTSSHYNDGSPIENKKVSQTYDKLVDRFWRCSSDNSNTDG